MASRELNILVAAKGALQAARDVGKVDTAVKKVGASARRVGKVAAVGIGAGVGVAAVVVGRSVQSGLENLALLEDATTQVEGALKRTGQAGTVTAGEVAGWANEIEASVQAAFDDKAITSATATLIRFGKVTKANLRPAMVVMTDLAAKTGSVESASTLLAKALADPAKAAGKLARVGVVLTKQQQDQIKTLVKAGKTEQAQTLLLNAMAEATKGAAAASAGPYRDSLNILQDVTEDAQKALAVGFLPVITKVRDILSKKLADPKTLDALKGFGKSLAGGLEKLIDVAMGLPWDSIGNAFRIMGTGSKALLDAFLGLPPWVQTAVITGWGLNKITGGALSGIVGSLASGLIKGILGINAGVVNINAAVVNGGGGGIPGAAAGAAGVGATALAGTGLIAVTFAAGAASSMRAILDAANRNNALAERGLTAAEITAVKYFSGTPQYQQEALKHLGRAPSRADFESGMAKLNTASTRTKDDVVRAVAFGARSTRDKIETAKIAQVSATAKSAAAARQAGQQAAAAIRDKKISPPSVRVTVNTAITLRETIRQRQTYLRFGNIRTGGIAS